VADVLGAGVPDNPQSAIRNPQSNEPGQALLEIVAAREDFVLPERYGGRVERDLRARSGARSAPIPSAAPERARRSRSTLLPELGCGRQRRGRKGSLREGGV
jgi:hypothetical protein